MRKGRYNGKSIEIDIRIICTKAVQGIANNEEYFERLILKNEKYLILFENSDISLS